MTTEQDNLTIELIHEEIAILMFFMERHHRWALSNFDHDVARQQRAVADTIKDAADAAHVLIERIKR